MCAFDEVVGVRLSLCAVCVDCGSFHFAQLPERKGLTHMHIYAFYSAGGSNPKVKQGLGCVWPHSNAKAAQDEHVVAKLRLGVQ